MEHDENLLLSAALTDDDDSDEEVKAEATATEEEEEEEEEDDEALCEASLAGAPGAKPLEIPRQSHRASASSYGAIAPPPRPSAPKSSTVSSLKRLSAGLWLFLLLTWAGFRTAVVPGAARMPPAPEASRTPSEARVEQNGTSDFAEPFAREAKNASLLEPSPKAVPPMVSPGRERGRGGADRARTEP